MQQKVYFQDLGSIEYGEAWKYQESMLFENAAIKKQISNGMMLSNTSHHLLFCEHPPVYTLGKSGNKAHVLVSNEELARRNIGFYETNRGGDITFHGPGQIVGYPILDLEKYYRDIGRYLRSLEEVVIQTIAEYGIKGARSNGETGVWMDPDDPLKARKICAMGVRCSRWITMHGFALNVNTNLEYFTMIVPCGIPDKQVTSLEKEVGTTLELKEVKKILKSKFEQVFDCELV